MRGPAEARRINHALDSAVTGPDDFELDAADFATFGSFQRRQKWIDDTHVNVLQTAAVRFAETIIGESRPVRQQDVYRDLILGAETEREISRLGLCWLLFTAGHRSHDVSLNTSALKRTLICHSPFEKVSAWMSRYSVRSSSASLIPPPGCAPQVLQDESPARDMGILTSL
jgi:hypothetical protein